MTMDAKDLRTDSIDRQRNEFINYEHSDPRTLCSNQNYVDSNAIPKMDVQTSRPCAIIGPDRVVPQSLSNLEFSIRKNCTEWNYKENPVCPSPDHYEKILKHHPLRNISPRQTYQENMQRVMIPPHIDTMKGTDVPTNFTNGRNLTKNSTIHLADPKHIDVPYNVPQTPTEQRNFGNSEMYIPQPAGTTIPPHGWTPSNTMPGRTYPQFSPSNMYRYPEYSNHTSYPVPIAHSHHMIPEESSHLYSNQFYRPGNVRYEPYPSSKDRVQHVRYEYINNYPISCNPMTYTSHKIIPPQTYATYNQVPLKYLRPHINDIPPERFQRPINPIHAFNSTYHSHEFTQNYTSAVNANGFPNKIPYPNDNIIKPKQISKSSNMSKMYPDYEPSFIKPCHQPENIYMNKMIPPNHMKESVITNFPSLNVQPMSHLLQYQRNINEMPNFKNTNSVPQFKTIPNDNINRMARLHRQFSPNAPYLDSSPNFNLISNQNILQEGCTYINQSSIGKRKSVESNKMQNLEFYKACDTIYGSHESSNQLNRGSCHNKVKLLTDKNIDVRQFFQMWNEGDEENIDGNGTNPPATTDDCIANDAPIKSSSKPDQLYVLDLVTVPTEELGKYEHIEKISKLPDNIKGYNHIELLNQFEKVLGNSNVKYKYLQSTNSNKGLHHTDNKSSQRPLSPLDVEAKISQSVIHKEVGCNFEIKPCSPKALTVDIVAPAQATSIERQIEKVINPHVQSLPLPSTQNDISNDCDLVEEHAQQLKLQLEEPSTCKLTEAHGSDIGIKTNYNLQEFNTNSGVYLASLPRLDNDIEFNFPEVNQQFLDANKMESEVNKSKYTNTVYPLVNETSHKNSLHELQSSAFSESNKVIKETLLIDVKSPIPPDFENAKESTKLSKFRKIKNHVPNVSENSLVKAQCSDSVIARTGDTENIPTLEVDTILNFDESTDDFSAPMNLSSSKSHVIQYVTSVNSIQTVKKLENGKNMPSDGVIDLASNSMNNQKNSCLEIIENKIYSEEKHNILQNIVVEETVIHNLPYAEKSVKESRNSMEIDDNKAEADKTAPKKVLCTSYEVNLKNIEPNINENVTELDQAFVKAYKNKSDSKVAEEPQSKSCIRNISDHCTYESESKTHQMDDLQTFSCPNELNLSMPYNKAVQEIVDTESKKNLDKNVNVNPQFFLNNSNINNIKDDTYEYTRNDTSNYVLSNCNGTSEINSVTNKKSGELELNQGHGNIEESITEDKIVTSVLETELPFNSSCVLRLSENNKSIDPYVIKTDITNNKDFQLDIIGQDINLKSEQDANQNVSFVTKDKTVNTNISTHKILVYCEKQEFINKDIINQENNATINSCDMNFSTESKETSDEIELVASENNIENSNSIQLPFGSPSVQQTKKYNTTTAKCELHMDVDVICGSDIIDIDKPGSKIMISNNSIIKEENKQTSFSGVIEIAHDVQSQGHNEEIKSKIHRSVFRQTFSKEIFSPRIQNLLINSEGIIKKELTSCEISVLTGVSKDVYSEENFIGTESQNIQSVIIPCVQNEVIKSMQENLSEKVANDPIEKQSDIVLELNSSETFGSFNNLPTLINIEENNQMALSDDCNESDNSKTSQFSTSAIHNYGTKDIIVKKSLKCSKCETSCRNYSTPKSRLLSRKLRSLSESDICQYDLEFSNNENSYNKHYLSRQKKTKRDVNLTLDVDNRISVSNNCRRNSIASILNDQNLSVCILIDSDCLITDESLDNVEGNECYSFQEDEEILCSNEDSVSTTVIVPIENDTIQEETMQQNNEADICVDKDYGDFWVDDVGCIETVVSDEIIESNENSLPIFETEKDDMPVEPLETEFGKNFDSAKIKAIYGSNILKSDIKLVESLYKTPQMNVNDKLKRATNSPIQIEDENIPNKTLCVNAQLSTTSTISDKSIKNESESLTVSDLDICRKNISDNHTMKYDYHKKISHSLSTSIEKYLTQSEDDYESDSSNVFPNKSSTSLVQRHINLLPTMEISNPIQINSFNTSASSSPEVSSTTSEEKSNILLKICKYDTSIATCIKPENESEFFKKGLRCKLTEVNHYGKPGHSSNSFKPLITKAAQKYIPPPKGTDNNLKIKLPLSEHRLEKLKRLKISKDIPKLKNNDFICSRDMESSKKKPNFEDVLRSIDEVQYKLHKSKCKIKQTIPKVVIKKNENGSHYASTSKMYNPDLTGRKWQPWVFLEKNYFIDKMALKKNTKAIYCHKRDTYVIADKIGNNKKDEPSGTSTKLIISRPKGSLFKVPLKYTIRWTHPY